MQFKQLEEDGQLGYQTVTCIIIFLIEASVRFTDNIMTVKLSIAA